MDINISHILLIITFSMTKFCALSLTPSEKADIYLYTPELVSKYGYPAETHTVTTPDGYILNMHRIPYSPKSPSSPGKPVVFLQHGMMASSADYVIPGPYNSSLGYLLADAGYDVFMGNARGNMYSQKHVNLTSNDKEYWNFSWNEMALYDVTTEIDYILKTTGQEQIYYIGMSMGTTMFFVLASERPEYSQKIKLMIAMAPIAYFNKTSSTTIAIRNKYMPRLRMAQIFGINNVKPHNWISDWKAEEICAGKYGVESCFRELFPEMTPEEEKYVNKSVLPVVSAHFPAGLSLKTILHYMQIMKSGKFEQWDYGTEENLRKYHQATPPEYNISAITIPVALLGAHSDVFNGPPAVAFLCKTLQNCVENYEVPRKTFDHLEFVFGLAIDIKQLAYDKILELLQKH